MRRVSVLSITMALIAGTVACTEPVPEPPIQYDLTISSSEGGAVAAPGEGTFTYDSGTVVSLVATQHAGYRFVEWTGDVEKISNTTTFTTTITMHGDYSILARFAERPVYQLTVTGTEGGSIQVPGDGSFAYHEATVVPLVAEPEPGYHFVEWSGDATTIVNVKSAVTTVTILGDSTIIAVFQKTQYTPMVAAGWYHTVGLKADGTVLAVGSNHVSQCDIGDWTDIVQVATGYYHTVGLRSDGTVVAEGENRFGECDVGDWVDVVQVAAGVGHTVGLKSNGTVVAVGSEVFGRCDVREWSDIVSVVAGFYHTAGLKSNGTVVAVGSYGGDASDLGGWTDIIQLAAGWSWTAGLRSDGATVALGYIRYAGADVSNWSDISMIAGGEWHIVGVGSDRTVVAGGHNDHGQCDVYQWKDIIWIAAGGAHTVGLKADGTVVAVGANDYGQCDVGGWNLAG